MSIAIDPTQRLKEDGQIIKEATKLAHLPVTIVQGRYDLVCPMKTGTVFSQEPSHEPEHCSW